MLKAALCYGKRAAIYGRVSGSTQEKEETIQTQFDVCAQWCLKNGYTVVAYYADTNCRNTVPMEERKLGGRRLLKDAADPEREFDIVVIYEIWRWSRENSVWYAARDALRAYGVELLSVMDDLRDDTPGDELTLDVKLAVGKYAGKMIALNCENGKKTWAGKGAHVGGQVPYGYIPDRETEAEGRHRAFLVPNHLPLVGVVLAGREATEAWVVECIYEWYTEAGLSLTAIAGRLNAAGVPVSSRSTGSGDRWNWKGKATAGFWEQKGVGRILAGPVYKGERFYGADQIPQRVLPLVTGERWEAAQVRRAARGKPPRSAGRYLLTGLVWCEHHNLRMCGQTPGWCKEHGSPCYYMVCPMKYRPGQGCPTDPVRGDHLEAELWELVKGRLADHEGTVERIRANNDQFASQQQALIERRDQQQAQIMKKDRQANQTLRALIDEEDPDFPAARARALITELEGEIADLKASVAALDAELEQCALTEAQIQGASDWLATYREKLDQPFTRSEQREVLVQFVKGVRVTTKEEITRVRYQLCYDPELHAIGRSSSHTPHCMTVNAWLEEFEPSIAA